ncbi:MAG: aminotransferase class IV [Cyanobacteria bacterium J06638_7]
MSAGPHTAIAWIDAPPPGGRWGSPQELALPLCDRGLQLADGLFDTVLVLDGRPRLLEQHLARWHGGAALLGLEPPPNRQRVAALAREAIARSGIRNGALRLNWSRGAPAAGPGRGLTIPDRSRHRFWLQLTAANPCFAPLRVIVSPTERRCASSLLSRCKSFGYGSAIQARRQARAAGADDALLSSSAGGLCCGTSANLLLRGPGGPWLTPPLASGCLAGVMRGRALELELAREAVISAEELAAGSGAVLLNSLGCRPISRLEGKPLGGQPKEQAEGLAEALAEALWRRLLGS